MLKYHVDFEFKHIDSDEPHLASVPFEADHEPATNEEFDELAKTLFRLVDGCEQIRVLRVYEDSELVRNISSALSDLGEFTID